MKNKFIQFAFLFAALLFVCGFSGGQYLHSKIHHHESAQAQEECPFQALLQQAFLFVALAVVIRYCCVQRFSTVVKQSFRRFHVVVLPLLRAPPASLI